MEKGLGTEHLQWLHTHASQQSSKPKVQGVVPQPPKTRVLKKSRAGEQKVCSGAAAFCERSQLNLEAPSRIWKVSLFHPPRG